MIAAAVTGQIPPAVAAEPARGRAAVDLSVPGASCFEIVMAAGYGCPLRPADGRHLADGNRPEDADGAVSPNDDLSGSFVS